jgi:hypothetical protein
MAGGEGGRSSTLKSEWAGLARMRPCGDWIELNGPRLTSTPYDQLGGRA